MDTPLASILICNYNYGQFIRKAIDSALNQTYPHLEVIVVDDGSTDSSQEIIRSYGDRITAIFKENGGQASAFNEGFKRSRGEVIFFLDSDDSFAPQKVEVVVGLFKRHPEIGWCFNSQVEVNTATGQVLRKIPAPETGGPTDFRSSIIHSGNKPPFAPATSCTSFRRDTLSKILPMPEGKSVYLNDNYIKFASTLLAKGILLNQDLTYMGIHGTNLYTHNKKANLIHAKCDILTAYWLRQNFPDIKKLADRLFRTGLAHYWQHGREDQDYKTIVQQYLSLTKLTERMQILLVAWLHYSNVIPMLKRLKFSS